MLLFLCSLSIAAAEFSFASNGKEQCVIAMPDEPVGFEKDAVEDLRTYLGKMTGAKFQVFPESKVPANKSVIYVGQTEFAKKQKINFNKLNPEEWIIRTVGKNLILSGGKPIGSVYAVWQLLNSFGCYTLTWDQDAVPTYKVLKKDIANEQKKPSFSGRMIYSRTPSILRHSGAPKHILNKFVNWKHRNGINGRHNPVDNQWTYSAHYISHVPSSHSLSLYVSPKLFKEHPEYFSMNEAGKRTPPRRANYGGSVCMSNPKVAEITLDSLRKMIKKDRANLPKDRWPSVYDISELDGMVYICKCTECKVITEEEGGNSGLLLRYINSVAREIKKEYPDIFIRTFCYGYNTGTPPKKVRPESNVLIQLCDKFSISDPFHPLSHPMNIKRKEYFEGWRKIAKRIMVWDYWTVGANPHPCTVFNAMPEDLKYFHSLNVTDMFLEASRNTYSPQSFIDLSYFVASQLMLNIEQDPEKLADIYLKYYFGPAEPQMRKLFNDIRQGVSQQKNIQASRALNHWTYLTPDFMSKRYVELKKLAESLPKGNIYRQRVNAERMPFIWYVISNRESYREAFMKYAKTNVDDLVEEWRTLVDEYLRRYPCDKPYNLSNFEAAYNKVAIKYPRPEKFKSLLDKDIRITGWTNFKGRITNYSSVVKDPDSITGKALIANHPDPVYHGVNKSIPGSYSYKTTTFSWKNLKYTDYVRLTVKKVPQDEKYHWYKFPGKLVLKNNSTVFYAQTGQAINIDTTHLFDFINTDAKSNTWTAWFSAKFTGPAYVKDSKKQNAVYIDMLVLTRGDVK